MLYDLNLFWSPSTSVTQLERTLKFAASLGYDVVALNHTVSAPIPSHIANPIPQITEPLSCFTQPHQQGNRSGNDSPAPPTTQKKIASPVVAPASPRSKLPTTLRRVTVVISDPATNHKLPAFAAVYDIVAVRPTTEKAFAACCTNMSEFSIISLDLTAQYPFHFHPRTSMAAVSRGVRFEICYSQALFSASSTSTSSGLTPADSRARANFIANVSGLVRATKGRGIIVSSEAAGPLALRGPADVVNMLAVWGLAAEKGAEGLGINPRAVVVNEGIKRRGFRGVIDVIHGAETTAADSRPGEDARDGGSVKEAKKRSKQDKAGTTIPQRGQPHQGQKRRTKDADSQTGPSPSTTGGREAKRSKVVAR
ncbi:hypothetical protein VTK73DRAFT_7180 [Phialemonium thermophilum]|uniref:Uncharacterized protein n=1 Tax=Phialemonium thermophilum TaxID=223376 RepID=A0ABR3XUU1_9PEZI